MFTIIFWILLFIGGYIIIFFSADIFLDNLKDLCVFYGLSAFIIGSLILGIDIEESIASIIASVNGLPYIAVGNVIGNSIIAATLCFALPALIYKFKFKLISQFYFWVIYAAVFAISFSFFINFGLLIVGIIAISIYGVYFVRNIKHSHKVGSIKEDSKFLNLAEKAEKVDEEEEKSKRKMIILVIISFFIIVLGGELMILSAQEIIGLTGISESVFGFVIIAFVTNVEEITLMIKSIKKHSIEIGMGGMLGKLIWNLTITFGISAIILKNIVFIPNLIWNAIILLIVILTLNLLARKKFMNRKVGIILIIFFTIFLIINLI